MCQKVMNTAGDNFFTGWWEPKEKWFWQFKPFSKLKTTFYEYWTSIKIKISMTCVWKEYEIKTKMVQAQCLHLKFDIYIYIYIYKRALPIGFYIFINNEEAPYTSHISCAEVAIFWKLTHRYMWYIFSLVCSVFVIQ